jgi:hypothetical protein
LGRYAIVNGKRDNAVECTTLEYIKVVQYFEKVAFRGSVVTCALHNKATIRFTGGEARSSFKRRATRSEQRAPGAGARPAPPREPKTRNTVRCGEICPQITQMKWLFAESKSRVGDHEPVLHNVSITGPPQWSGGTTIPRPPPTAAEGSGRGQQPRSSRGNLKVQMENPK